jgi:uncharacterized protein (TIGR02265 family)
MVGAGGSKLIFSNSMEALLKVMEGRITTETQKALAALRIGPPHKLEPAYPAENWAQAVKLISADLFPSVDTYEQHRQLGRATVLQFADTFMGKAMFGAAKIIGARRSLERMTRNLRTGANFIETRFTVIDEKTQEFWMSDVTDVPGFYAGLIGAGADVIPGWPDRIEVKKREGAACLFEFQLTR